MRNFARWIFSDGTVLDLGGDVIGWTVNARKIRALLSSQPVYVWVELPPDGAAMLDTMNVFLMHRFACEVAYWLGLTLETAYAPRLEDAPNHVQKLVRDLKAQPRDPETIY